MKEPAFLLEASLSRFARHWDESGPAAGDPRWSPIRAASSASSRTPNWKREVDENSGNTLNDLMDQSVFPHIHTDQGLDLALERMGSNQIDMLPVVSRADIHQLVGIITLQDVLDAYGVSHS